MLLRGKVCGSNTRCASKSVKSKTTIPMPAQPNNWYLILAVLNHILDKIGTLIQINAIGPQNAVAKPLSTEAAIIKYSRMRKGLIPMVCA